MITIYCDGSCNCKSRLGGLGVFVDIEEPLYISEGYQDTTISRMELRAAINGLKLSKQFNLPTVIVSDSEYVIKSLNEKRLVKWEMIGWENVKNIDLWKQIQSLLKESNNKILFRHIRGHQADMDNPDVLGNNIADRLADYKQFKIYKQDERN